MKEKNIGCVCGEKRYDVCFLRTRKGNMRQFVEGYEVTKDRFDSLGKTK